MTVWSNEATIYLTNVELAYVYEILKRSDSYDDDDVRMELHYEGISTADLHPIDMYNALGEYLDEIGKGGNN